MKKTSLLVASVVSLLVFGLIVYFNIKKDKNDIEYLKVDYTGNVEFTDEEQIIAIAYLNNIEEVSSKYIDNFENIKVYQIGDELKYLIIPRYEGVEVSIYEIKDNEENLISFTKLPFIISCDNYSVMFKIKYKDITFDYSPSLDSGEESYINKYVIDITK